MIILNQGSQTDPDAIRLETSEARWIKNSRKKPYPKERMEAAKQYLEKQFGSKLLQLRSLRSDYNCFGMVFANRRTCIVSGEEVEKVIFQDDRYQRVQELSAVAVGDVAVYRKAASQPIEHVGIVVDVVWRAGDFAIKVLSQWGFDGEWLHLAPDVPLVYGRHIEYWSERRNP